MLAIEVTSIHKWGTYTDGEGNTRRDVVKSCEDGDFVDVDDL